MTCAAGSAVTLKARSLTFRTAGATVGTRSETPQRQTLFARAGLTSLSMFWSPRWAWQVIIERVNGSGGAWRW